MNEQTYDGYVHMRSFESGYSIKSVYAAAGSMSRVLQTVTKYNAPPLFYHHTQMSRNVQFYTSASPYKVLAEV